MESNAAVETMEAIGASTSALAVFVGRATGNVSLKGGQASGGVDPLQDQPVARLDGAGLDPLRDQADAYLDGLAELAKVEARLAALKVQLVAGYANTEKDHDGALSFRRVLTDPRDGAPLEIGRTSYRIPKPTRQWLRLRDAKCTFPAGHRPPAATTPANNPIGNHPTGHQ